MPPSVDSVNAYIKIDRNLSTSVDIRRHPSTSVDKGEICQHWSTSIGCRVVLTGATKQEKGANHTPNGIESLQQWIQMPTCAFPSCAFKPPPSMRTFSDGH